MYKSCSRCGKIHDINYKCNVGKVYKHNEIDKLRSTTRWTNKSKAIREASNYLCEICKDEGIYNYEDVQVHHILKLQNNPELLLEDSNLICLCPFHHKKADNGEISIEYLQELARKRDEKYEK